MHSFTHSSSNHPHFDIFFHFFILLVIGRNGERTNTLGKFKMPHLIENIRELFVIVVVIVISVLFLFYSFFI